LAKRIAAVIQGYRLNGDIWKHYSVFPVGYQAMRGRDELR